MTDNGRKTIDVLGSRSEPEPSASEAFLGIAYIVQVEGVGRWSPVGTPTPRRGRAHAAARRLRDAIAADERVVGRVRVVKTTVEIDRWFLT